VVTAPSATDELVTLARFGDLTTAQLVCGRLEADGIDCFIPDEVVAAQTWHLSRAIGGIRVQVHAGDLDRAQQILAQPGLPEPAENEIPPAPDGVSDDGTISQGDRAAHRALRVALVSLWLMGLIHPYSLWLAIRSLSRGDLTAWGRRRAFIAILVSLGGCVWMGLLVYRLVKIAG
jgi:hypothetical protein